MQLLLRYSYPPLRFAKHQRTGSCILGPELAANGKQSINSLLTKVSWALLANIKSRFDLLLEARSRLQTLLSITF